ncbi:alpha/beta fold hydrolase [Phenylobacterium sp.]|uniref:S9 family peptidase n=1 Tax=Phenylobacterium sp. TaxID=1871053 RepID=UPI0039839CF8
MNKLAAALVALAALSAVPANAQVVKREQGQLVMENVPVTPPDVREALRRYQNARSAGFMDWLADGSMLVSTRFGQTGQVHRVTTPGGQRTQITFFDEPVAGAQGVPGQPGRYMFTRDVGGAEYFQGYLAGLTGPDVAFTEPNTRNAGFVFSKDGQRLAWSRVTPGSGDYDIMLMDVANPATRKVALEGTGALSPIAFSPDGTQLLLGRRLSVQSSKRFLMNLATGQVSEIHPSKAEIAFDGGEFTPDGRAILMLSDEGSEVARLVSYDIASKRITPVADGGAWEIERFDLSDDGRTLAYAVNEDGRSKVVVRDLVTRRALPQPSLPVGVAGGLKFSPDGRRLAIGLNSATSPADIWVWDLAPATLTRWTYSEMGGLDPAAMVEPSLARFKSFDGREIPAWVYKPRTAGKAPVIISIHGGPEGQSRPTFSSTYQYYVNELGAAVIVPNVRGSTGYGKTFVSLDNGMKRRESVRDIGALLDWIATQPDLDAGRVVVTGGSYGGYMTLAAFADYNDRLAGAVDTVGISNWLTFLANTEGYRRDLRRAEYGDERLPAMRAYLEKDSPIAQTAQMKKPLFVIAGFNDPRVPWTEGQQIVEKVRANGGEVWWMMARDEGHGFRKKQNTDALREAETLFLKKVFETR